MPDIRYIKCFGLPVDQGYCQKDQHKTNAAQDLVLIGSFQFSFTHAKGHKGIGSYY